MRIARAFFSSLLFLAIVVSIAFAGDTSSTAPPAPNGTSTVTPSVVLVQTTSSGALALGTIMKTRISVPVTFEERNGAIAPGLTIRVDPLLHLGEQVALDFKPEAGKTFPMDLAPTGTVSGTLTADLPSAGDYSSAFRVIYGGKVQATYPITLTRADAVITAPTALPLDPGELNDVVANVWPYVNKTVVLTTTVTPSGAEAVTISEPVLRSLTLAEGTTSFDRTGATMDVTSNGTGNVEFPRLLKPGEVQPLQMKLTGVDGAGKYTAKLRFAAAGHTPIDKSITIYAREGAWVAFIFTLIGVFISWRMRNWMTERRPKLALELRPAALELELTTAEQSAPADETAKSVIAAVRNEVGGVYAHAVAAKAWTDMAPFDLLDHKVKLLQGWIITKRAVDQARPASVRNEVAGDLDAVQAFLRTPGGSAAELTKQDETLAGIQPKLDVAVLTAINNRIKELGDQLTTLVQKRPKLKTGIDLKVRPLIEAATANVEGNDRAAALSSIEDARRQFAVVLAGALSSDLERPKPDQVSARTWDDLKARLLFPLKNVERAASPDDAMRRFEAALQDYLRTLAADLTATAKKELQTSTDEARKAVLAQVVTTLAAVEQKALGNDLFGAWADLASAHAELTGFDDRAASSLGLEDPAQPSRPGALASNDSLREGVEQVEIGKLPKYRPAAQISKELTRGDLIAALVAIVIAAMVGVGAIYKVTPNWGGPWDQFQAVLWGLGVHQLAYNGLSSIFDKFK